MDDEYDLDLDEFDSLDELEDSDELGDTADGSGRDLNELEELGVMDGEQDAISGSYYTGYGMSVEDLSELSDEERDAYEMGYHTWFGAGGGGNTLWKWNGAGIFAGFPFFNFW